MSTLSSPRTPRNLPLLLGESSAITSLRREIEAAARTDAKVLVLGETGSGKEVVARLIHEHSQRSSRAFVAVNCSGIPETLLESELFGHTRGSFTGAYRDKPGLVRQADRGTLFLDELGEMSLRMQAVLLRFAETGEIQTIGVDGVTGRSDVRLITATNRNLRERIDAGVFREDLYFRLNIIQIHVPPLRERSEDVMLLLRHYLRKASETHRLHCPELTPDAEQLLSAYAWPGNVRELENFMERSVILTEGTVLRAPLAELATLVEDDESPTTLHAAEKEHIVRVLREAHGVISGPRGAAARLGLKRTTLQYKMQKLGITREDYVR